MEAQTFSHQRQADPRYPCGGTEEKDRRVTPRSSYYHDAPFYRCGQSIRGILIRAAAAINVLPHITGYAGIERTGTREAFMVNISAQMAELTARHDSRKR